nr:hypothetical protein GCM10020092_084870 [Actinoplanes digitatis]
MMLSSRRRAASSPKTRAPSAGRSSSPSGPRTAGPKASTTAAWPSVPSGDDLAREPVGVDQNRAALDEALRDRALTRADSTGETYFQHAASMPKGRPRPKSRTALEPC